MYIVKGASAAFVACRLPRPQEFLRLPLVTAAGLPLLLGQPPSFKAAFRLEADNSAKQASPTSFQNLIAALCL